MRHAICSCMINVLMRKRCLFCVIIAGIVVSTILYLIVGTLHTSHIEKKQRRGLSLLYSIDSGRAGDGVDKQDSTLASYGTEYVQSCRLPEIPLWSEEVNKYIGKPPPIKCDNEAEWVFTQNGKFYISSEAEKKHGRIHCVYVPIVNDKDSFKELDPIDRMLNGSSLVSDAFRVTCKAANGKRYTNIHACIAPISMNKTDDQTSDNFNILMFGFDSLSAQMLKRLLPKTHSYFTETLGGKLLEGYNIIGDATSQALMPMLTGERETEIPEVRKGFAGASHVDDVLTFIWTRCEKQGYVTQMGEDIPDLGAFNLRMLGFREQPVHHYARPFFLSAQRTYHKYQKFCHGSKPRFKVFVDWLKEGLITNKGKNFFTFGFFVELSHNDNDPVVEMDDGNVQFLDYINSQGILDNTVLLLMSDHGLRSGPFRSTEQGKLEERLPYFGFRFPEKFKQMYPSKVRAFELNTKRLVTPFDVHETLLDIIGDNVTKNASRLGRSLLKEISPHRTCAEAGIAPHWCACLNQTRVSESDFNIKKSVNAVLTTINDLLEPFDSVCNKMTLQSITKAVKLQTNKDVLKFRKSLGYFNWIPDLNDTLEAKEVIYQVSFITKPNQGMFEATIRMDSKTGNCTVNTNEISRTNTYGDDPWCILDDHPILRPYCVCRNKRPN